MSTADRILEAWVRAEESAARHHSSCEACQDTMCEEGRALMGAVLESQLTAKIWLTEAVQVGASR